MRRHSIEQNLAKPDRWRSLRWIIAVPASWVGASVLALQIDQPLIWVAVWALQVLLLLSVVAGLHDGTHALLFPSSRANHIAAQVCGMVLLVPYGVYRAYHLQHHSKTHSEGDPEGLLQFANVWQYLLFTPLSVILFAGELWIGGLRTVLGFEPKYVRTPSQRRIVVASFATTVATTTALAVATVRAPALLLTTWWIPYLAGTVVISIILIPEHYLCRVGPASSFETTRSTRSNPVLRFFFWGTNFHAEHHILPNVPAHRLGPLHDQFGEDVQNVERSYLGWHIKLVRLLIAGNQPDNDALRGPAIDLRTAPSTTEQNSSPR